MDIDTGAFEDHFRELWVDIPRAEKEKALNEIMVHQANGTEVLAAYAEKVSNTDEPEVTNLTDLLCDLMHTADAKGISFDDAYHAALRHYAVEIQEAGLEAAASR